MFTRQQARQWDPSTTADSANAQALVDEAVEAQFQVRASRLASVGKKVRRNRGSRAAKERRTVEALVLDALAHHLSGLPEYLVIRLSSDWLSAGPSDVVARNRTVNDRLHDLERAQWLESDKKTRLNGRYVTALYPGPQLIAASKRLQVTLLDLGVQPPSPEIELRGHKPKGVDSRQPVLSFVPTRQTRAALQQLVDLNERLRRADLRSTQCGRVVIDVRRRGVSRAFLDGSFERGGRLNGPAFWLSLRKDIRRAALRIDGEPIAEVDIQAAMPSIAYALEGGRPACDPYQLTRPKDIPRDAVKLALMQMLWTYVKPGTPLSQEARSLIPRIYRAGEVFNFIRQHNQPIAHRLGAQNPCGAELMWHESEIIIEATLRCFSSGFSALPLHDALLVAASRGQEARLILSATFKDRLGVPPTINIKRFDNQPPREMANV